MESGKFKMERCDYLFQSSIATSLLKWKIQNGKWKMENYDYLFQSSITTSLQRKRLIIIFHFPLSTLNFPFSILNSPFSIFNSQFSILMYSYPKTGTRKRASKYPPPTSQIYSKPAR